MLIIDKFLLIFSAFEYPKISEYLIMISKVKEEMEKRLYVPSFEMILGSLSNPLDNDELMRNLNEQLNKNGKTDIRTTWISTDKRPKDKPMDARETYNTLKKIILDYMNFYFDLCERKNFEGVESIFSEHKDIVTRKNCNELRKFVNENIDMIFSLVNIIALEPKNLQGKNLTADQMKIVEFIHAYLGFTLGEEHYGKKDYRDRVKKPLPERLKNNISKGTGVRIYLNTSNSRYIYLFLNEYIKKCQTYGIECDMKGIRTELYETLPKDRTVFYSIVTDLPIRIKILEEIKREHPEWIETFGTPSLATGRINDSYYGISHSGTYHYDQISSEYYGYPVTQPLTETFNDVFDNLMKYAYYSNLAYYAVNCGLISNKTITDFAYLRNIKVTRGSGILGAPIHYYGINNVRLTQIVSMLEKSNIAEKLRMKGISLDDDNWIRRLKKRVQALANISQKRNINAQTNICISASMEYHLRHELKAKTEEMIQVEEPGMTRKNK